MSFQLTILGTGSASPVIHRNPTAHHLTIENEGYLIDCGEGTQFQLLKYKVKANRIKYIFISHLHGDHYLGLTGLISSLNMHHRFDDLYIFGPAGLDEIISLQLKYSHTQLNFSIHFQAVDTQESSIILENTHVRVRTIPLRHRVPCCGYLVESKQGNVKLIKEILPPQLSVEQLKTLSLGQDVPDSTGKVLYAAEHYTVASPSDSYAFCSDTCFHESIVPLIQGVKLLYHETTFLHELLDRAQDTLHTTAWQAGTIAQMAAVKHLLIGHFSSRYKDVHPLLAEAKSVFERTLLAEDGLCIDFKHL